MSISVTMKTVELQIYYSVKAPWLQVKLLRILQFFPKEYLMRHHQFVNEVLYEMLTNNVAPPPRPPPTKNKNS